MLPDLRQRLFALAGARKAGGGDVAGDEAPSAEQRLHQPEQRVFHTQPAHEMAPEHPGVGEAVLQCLPAHGQPQRRLNAGLQKLDRAIQRLPVQGGGIVVHRHRAFSGILLMEKAVQRDLKIAVAAGSAISRARFGDHHHIRVQRAVRRVVAQKAQRIALLLRSLCVFQQRLQKCTGVFVVQPVADFGQILAPAGAFAPDPVAEQHVRPVCAAVEGRAVGGGDARQPRRRQGGSDVSIAFRHGIQSSFQPPAFSAGRGR